MTAQPEETFNMMSNEELAKAIEYAADKATGMKFDQVDTQKTRELFRAHLEKLLTIQQARAVDVGASPDWPINSSATAKPAIVRTLDSVMSEVAGALIFYATPENYHEAMLPLMQDGGVKAKEALDSLREKGLM